MITTILQKCLDELSKESPDLSYIRGMIEVLLATQEKPVQSIIMTKQDGTYKKFEPPKVSDAPVDEASILDAKARAALETVKAFGGKQEL